LGSVLAGARAAGRGRGGRVRGTPPPKKSNPRREAGTQSQGPGASLTAGLPRKGGHGALPPGHGGLPRQGGTTDVRARLVCVGQCRRPPPDVRPDARAEPTTGLNRSAPMGRHGRGRLIRRARLVGARRPSPPRPRQVGGRRPNGRRAMQRAGIVAAVVIAVCMTGSAFAQSSGSFSASYDATQCAISANNGSLTSNSGATVPGNLGTV